MIDNWCIRKNPVGRFPWVPVLLIILFLAGSNTGCSSKKEVVSSNENFDGTGWLEQGFKAPLNPAKPRIWWHWINGHISAEAITRDLEAMKQAGFGGFTLFNTSEGTPPGPVKYMSREWWDLLKHTKKEAERLGLEMGVHNGAGWSSSGGPWVTPDKAMQEVVWTEKQLSGPSVFDGTLDIPLPALGIERDMKRDPEINKRYYVPREKVRGYYRDIALLAFPTPKSEKADAPFRIENWWAKAGFEKMKKYSPDYRNVPVSDIIDPSQIIDLTSKLDEQGRLRWNVPEGDWTLLRLGYQPTGRQNHPAPPEGRGLEVDKMSSVAIDFYWEKSISKIIEEGNSIQAKQVLKHILIDSYEVGHQNWTASFEKDFQEQRGYNLLKYLPALTGRVVGSLETAEKFLWDFRKTISDMVAQNYYGRFAELCRENGLSLSVEPYGNFGNTDDFTVAGIAGIPMNEWWTFNNNPDANAKAKLASSAAHTYGRTKVGSEAFTGTPGRIFEEYPGKLKAQGDHFFCLGINQFDLHVFAHDPYEKAPGLGLGAYGSHFDRRNTWWPYIKGWTDYLSRCQYMLRQGQFVADVLYYAGEDAPQAPVVREELQPSLPDGFDFDYGNREILRQIEVQDGKLVLPNGMGYRILVLPPRLHMRPEVLHVIENLVAAGATVVGPKPLHIPGLEGGKDSETTLKTIADRLWGDCDGQAVTMNSYGKGKIYWNEPLNSIFGMANLLPDFSYRVIREGSSGSIPDTGNGIEYIHRKEGETDLFFVSNQHDQPKIVEATFRIGNKMPELWDPETGRIEVASGFRATPDDRVVVTLRLEHSGSVFVVFRKPLQDEPGILSVEQDNKPANVRLSREKNRFFLQSGEAGKYVVKFDHGNSRTVNVPTLPAPIGLNGPWQVSFPPGWGAPEQIKLPGLISWTEHTDPGVKYFSGTATYQTQIEVPSEILSDGYRNLLDLGDVQVIAEVFVNGQSQGVFWKPPYLTDITNSLHPGINRIGILVTNLWVNRLVGDQQYPDDCEWTANTGSTAPGLGLSKIPDWVVNDTPRPSPHRKTFVTWQWSHLKNKELLPSGLLGPVRLVTQVKTEIDIRQ